MFVCRVVSNDSEIGLIGFASNNTENPDAFVVLNLSEKSRNLNIGIIGSTSRSFNAYRTSSSGKHVSLGDFTVTEQRITYSVPARSVTTFYASGS